MLKSIATGALLFVMMWSLAGCGNKGPLYLPEPAAGQEQDSERDDKSRRQRSSY